MDKTKSVKNSQINHSWHLIDVSGQVLGRQATNIARLLMGKHKTDYTPNMDCGDYVVVINASSVELTRGKEKKKIYYRHSGYVGNLKEERFDHMLQRRPDQVIRLAVKGMLPKNRLSDRMLSRLKIYPGSEHPHQAHFAKKQTKPAR